MEANTIENLFYQAYSAMSEEQVLEIRSRQFDGGINNVVNGLRPHSFSIWLIEERPNVLYHLVHTSGKSRLEGDVIEVTHNQEFRDELVLYFSNFLAHNYPSLDVVDVFNTFQDHTRTLLETLEYLTVSNLELADFEGYNVSIGVNNKRGIVPLRIIDKLQFYRDFFGYSYGHAHEGSEWVYLMLNTRNNLLKIGKSKNPKFREKTLQGDEPSVHLIAVWRASGKTESLLHSHFKENRVRGEWFDLSFRHLKELKEIMAVH